VTPPRSSSTPLTEDDYLAFPRVPADHRFTYGPDPQQFADLYLPRRHAPVTEERVPLSVEQAPVTEGQSLAGGRTPVMVMIHGGCWEAEYGLEPMGALCSAFRDEGFAVLSLEYRRLGSGGEWPAIFQDTAAGADLLHDIAADHSLDLERVIATGHSAGGHLALWLAARHRLPADAVLSSAGALMIHGVLALAPIPDLAEGVRLNVCESGCRDIVGGLPDEVPERYRLASPRELLPLGVSQRHIVGQLDEVVSAGYVSRFVATAAQMGDDARLLILPGAAHFDIVAPHSFAWPTVRDAALGMLPET